MKIKIVNTSKYELPSYSTRYASGMELRDYIEEDIVLKPLSGALIETGFFLEIFIDYEAQITPGNGLVINKGVTVLNSAGAIDSDYREEVCISLVNLSEDNYVIRDGERICHTKHKQAEWVTVESLLDTSRETGGFGYIGKN